VGEMIDCNLVTKQKVGGGLNLPIKLRKGQIVTTKLSDNSFAKAWETKCIVGLWLFIKCQF
jgi:hypothetical protein